MIARHVKRLGESETFLPFLLCLSTRSGDYIHSYKSIWNEGADCGDTVCKKGCIVTTVHQFQNLVASGLEGNMEMRHEGACVRRNPSYYLFGQKIRFDRGDSVTLYPFDFIETAEKVEETLPVVTTIFTYIYAGDDNLLPPLGGHISSHPHEFISISRTGASAGEGDGAVSAEIITPILHLQEIACAIPPFARGAKLLYRKGGGDFCQFLSVCHPTVDISGHLQFFVRAQDNVHTGKRRNLLGF